MGKRVVRSPFKSPSGPPRVPGTVPTPRDGDLRLLLLAATGATRGCRRVHY